MAALACVYDAALAPRRPHDVIAVPGGRGGNMPLHELLDCKVRGVQVMDLLARNIRPRDIVTRKALENAATVVAASGGSTNAALHLHLMCLALMQPHAHTMLDLAGHA